MCTELNTYVVMLLWSSLFFFLLQKRLFIPCCFWVENKEPAAELKGDRNKKCRIIFWEVGFSKLAGKGRGGWRQGCEKQFCCEPLGILGSSTSQVCLPWLSLGFPKCSFPININPLSFKDRIFGPVLLLRKGRPPLECKLWHSLVMGMLQPVPEHPGGIPACLRAWGGHHGAGWEMRKLLVATGLFERPCFKKEIIIIALLYSRGIWPYPHS